jgi:hypothetical protein
MADPSRSALIAILTVIVAGAAHAPVRADPAQTKAAASNDACSLLTKEDVAAALGGTGTGPKGTGVISSGPGETASSCSYTGAGSNRLTLSLMQLSQANASMYKLFCAKKSTDGLTGLGDVACWYDEKHEELQVLKGSSFFSIELRRSNPTEPIKTLAKSVYARLR